MFFLLYLELQRSDDADSALWVYSSARAAQRYPLSNHKGNKRKHATPTPLTPFGLLVADLSPVLTSLAPKCSRISDTIGFWRNPLFDMYSKKTSGCLLAVPPPQIPHVLTSQCRQWLIYQSPHNAPFNLRYFMGAGCVPVWCAGILPGVVGLQLSHLAIQRAQQRSNDLCQEQGHASSIIWCIVVVVVVATDTHTPRACVCCACITGTIACPNCPAS